MPVYLGFDTAENFVPEVHFGCFPQFFPQVWKTLARDQTRMESIRLEAAFEGRRL
jgi:hypothetical protein